jgi:hypothetical protein
MKKCLPSSSWTIKNKKFRAELIAYFPWYDMDRIENDASNNYIVACVFAAAGKFLPSRYLATIRGFLASRCLATVGDTDRDPQTDGMDLGSIQLRWAQVPWYIRTKFKDWFMHLEVDVGIHSKEIA